MGLISEDWINENLARQKQRAIAQVKSNLDCIVDIVETEGFRLGKVEVNTFDSLTKEEIESYRDLELTYHEPNHLTLQTTEYAPGVIYTKTYDKSLTEEVLIEKIELCYQNESDNREFPWKLKFTWNGKFCVDLTYGL